MDPSCSYSCFQLSPVSLPQASVPPGHHWATFLVSLISKWAEIACTSRWSRNPAELTELMLSTVALRPRQHSCVCGVLWCVVGVVGFDTVFQSSVYVSTKPGCSCTRCTNLMGQCLCTDPTPGPSTAHSKNCEPSRARKMGTEKCEKCRNMRRKKPPTRIGQFLLQTCCPCKCQSNGVLCLITRVPRPYNGQFEIPSVLPSSVLLSRVIHGVLSLITHVPWPQVIFLPQTCSTSVRGMVSSVNSLARPNMIPSRSSCHVSTHTGNVRTLNLLRTNTSASSAIPCCQRCESSTRPMFDSPATSTMLLFT